MFSVRFHKIFLIAMPNSFVFNEEMGALQRFKSFKGILLTDIIKPHTRQS